jgi:hypothetical protein
VPTWLHQRCGATATGPVVIPKIYNGRAKTFWSFGYEGLKINRNLSFTGTMPTERERNGDFSDLLKLGPTYQIYDPFTIKPAPGGRFSRQPIAGNIIPANRIDPVAKKILAFYPLPNQPGTADGRQNYFTTQKIDRSNRNFLGRVDHNFNEKHRLFVRYTQNYQFDTTVQFEGGATGTTAEQPGRGLAIDDVYTFSPTLIMNVRYSLSHQRPMPGRLTRGFDLLSLGFPQSLVNEIRTKNNFEGVTFPVINIPSFTTIGQDGGNTRSIYYHVFGNTFTKIINNHSIKFGCEYRLQR